MLDANAPSQRHGALLDRLDACTPALTGTVIGDPRLDPAVFALGHRDRDPRGRAAPQRLIQPLTDDLVEGDLRLLREALADGDVDVHLDPVRETDVIGQAPNRRVEALVA